MLPFQPSPVKQSFSLECASIQTASSFLSDLLQSLVDVRESVDIPGFLCSLMSSLPSLWPPYRLIRQKQNERSSSDSQKMLKQQCRTTPWLWPPLPNASPKGFHQINIYSPCNVAPKTGCITFIYSRAYNAYKQMQRAICSPFASPQSCEHNNNNPQGELQSNPSPFSSQFRKNQCYYLDKYDNNCNQTLAIFTLWHFHSSSWFAKMCASFFLLLSFKAHCGFNSTAGIWKLLHCPSNTQGKQLWAQMVLFPLIQALRWKDSSVSTGKSTPSAVQASLSFLAIYLKETKQLICFWNWAEDSILHFLSLIFMRCPYVTFFWEPGWMGWMDRQIKQASKKFSSLKQAEDEALYFEQIIKNIHNYLTRPRPHRNGAIWLGTAPVFRIRTPILMACCVL